MNLNEVINIRVDLLEQEKKMYLAAVNQINSQMKELLDNNMGTQFVQSCGNDLAGELIRGYFDTSDYNITVDQLAKRIIYFSYDDEYDPLAKNSDVQKLVYNYNDSENSSTLKQILKDTSERASLFTGKRNDSNERIKYREERIKEGDLVDDLTGEKGTYSTVTRNGKEVKVSELHADHIQARNNATYSTKYMTEKGIEKLKEFYNSKENMQMIDASANTSKSDAKVYEKNSDGSYKLDADGNKIDITYKATPEQLAEATIEQWERGSSDDRKNSRLIEKKYLDENGKVRPELKKELINNIKKSQNAESKVILKNADYKAIAKDAGKQTLKSIGKILGGQIIYYTMPPLLYEIRIILKDKHIKLDKFFEKLEAAKKRVCKYVISKLKDIFKNVLNSGLKRFIKSFFDIIINMVKATVKKMMKLAKNIVMAIVDAIKIISNKNATTREKADSVLNLFSITITTFIVEIFLEYIEKQFAIPKPLLLPLQTIITVVCTNIVMLILQKADLFDVRYGLLMSNIKDTFERENKQYTEKINALKSESEEKIQVILNQVKEEIEEMKMRLNELNIFSDDVQVELEKVNKTFNMNIDFEEEWNKYIGVTI